MNTVDHDRYPQASANERWQKIQAKFVDDPRKSVSEAHALVGEIMQHIVDGFSDERSSLERQWSQGQDPSTEELRVCLQRYREFFSRLLPLDQSTASVDTPTPPEQDADEAGVTAH